jgi:hypothetical protein
MAQNEHQRIRRHERRRQKMLENLEQFSMVDAIEIVYRDGKRLVRYVHDVVDEGLSGDPVLLHGNNPDPNSYHGSRIEPRDVYTSTPLYDLAYVRNPTTGQKVSLLPFQPPKCRTALE